MISEPAFQPIVDAAQAGASWARTRLYEWLAPAVAGYLRSQGIADPADATSDVFVSVLSRLGSFEGDARQFRSWVFTIAYRRAVDEWRAGCRRPIPAGDGSEALLGGRVAPPAEDVALSRLGEERLHRLLAELTHDQRQVLALRVIADLSIDEVASLLGKPAGAVKSLQHRALAALRRKIVDEAVSP